MLFAFVLLIISIPMAGFILLFEYGIRKERNQHITKKVRNILLIGLYTFLIGIVIYGWLERRHVITFDLDNEYNITLIGTEQESFLDWPIDFYIEVYSKSNNQELTADIGFFDGPYIQFLTSNNHPGIILLNGYNSNIGNSCSINMNSNELNSYEYFDHEQFSIKAQINMDFEVEHISPFPVIQ